MMAARRRVGFPPYNPRRLTRTCDRAALDAPGCQSPAQERSGRAGSAAARACHAEASPGFQRQSDRAIEKVPWTGAWLRRQRPQNKGSSAPKSRKLGCRLSPRALREHGRPRRQMAATRALIRRAGHSYRGSRMLRPSLICHQITPLVPW